MKEILNAVYSVLKPGLLSSKIVSETVGGGVSDFKTVGTNVVVQINLVNSAPNKNSIVYFLNFKFRIFNIKISDFLILKY